MNVKLFYVLSQVTSPSSGYSIAPWNGLDMFVLSMLVLSMLSLRLAFLYICVSCLDFVLTDYFYASYGLINFDHCYGLASAVVRCPLKGLGQSLRNLMCSIFRVRKQEIINFMTPTQRTNTFGVKCVLRIDVFLFFFKFFPTPVHR